MHLLWAFLRRLAELAAIGDEGRSACASALLGPQESFQNATECCQMHQCCEMPCKQMAHGTLLCDSPSMQTGAEPEAVSKDQNVTDCVSE